MQPYTSEYLEKYYETEYHNICKCKKYEYEQIAGLDDCCRNFNKIVLNDGTFFPNYRLYKQCKNYGGTQRNRPVKPTSELIFGENLISNILTNGGKEKVLIRN